MACFAPVMISRASSRSTCPTVGVNHRRTGLRLTFSSRGSLLLVFKSSGVASPASFNRVHCDLYSAAS